MSPNEKRFASQPNWLQLEKKSIERVSFRELVHHLGRSCGRRNRASQDRNGDLVSGLATLMGNPEFLETTPLETQTTRQANTRFGSMRELIQGIRS